ncbi:reverse transcriptase family protein [Rathayibacter sp. AY1F8]|uniref:reverse transcriptase family protein n=1 Tax=Rathayibacter sp. AY1F8 TaxID=2080562 RepID=UPI000CE790A7|nr:reverse transcriptase family protein [Rathayibacter sp. AY1F8]PPH19271.1 hypothetical protein C5C35_00710 [Rathayibacter sp. AY1F8]
MNLSPHLYRKNAPSGLDGAVVERAIKLTSEQRARGVEPILTLNHLAALSGTSGNYLHAVVDRQVDGYDLFNIRKRASGRRRSIAVPHPELAKVQKWLLTDVFSKVTVHSDCFSYRHGISIKDCASRHLHAEWMLKVDLSDFFHQIDERHVFGVASSLYEPLVAFEVSRIVTRQPHVGQPWLPKKYLRTVHQIPTKSSYPYKRSEKIGYLPQGASTSGYISNLVAKPLDTALSSIAAALELTYTRYSDDLAFSSARVLSRSQGLDVLREVARMVGKTGFHINESKTRFSTRANGLNLLGLTVDGESLRLQRHLRTRIEFHVSGVERFGANAHSIHCGFRDVLGMSHHILGLLAYASHIEPAKASIWRARLDASRDALLFGAPLAE